MIYITGDTHGEEVRFTGECLPGQSLWTKNDKLVVAAESSKNFAR